MRYCSIDIETTGLNRKNNDILEFGAVIDDLKSQLPISQLPKFHCYLLPPNNETYIGSPYALSMHSEIFLKISKREAPYTYAHPMKLGFMFKTFLVKNGYKQEHDKVVINAAGKNFASFDFPFLEEKTDLFKHIDIRHRILDPSILFLQNKDDSLPSLKDCKIRANKINNLNLPTEVSHTAIDDAIDVVYLIRSGLKSILEN